MPAGFAQQFVEEAARFANKSAQLRAVLDAALTKIVTNDEQVLGRFASSSDLPRRAVAKADVDLLQLAVSRAEINPHVAQWLVEEAARMARGSTELRGFLDAALTRTAGPRVKWTLHDKKLAVDLYDHLKTRLQSDVAYEELNRYWPQHAVTYWRKKISEFRADIRRLDPAHFEDQQDDKASD